MARYYFHLVDGTDTLLDPEGVEIDPGAVGSNALREARSIMAGDVIGGVMDLGFAIEVRDEQDALVYRLPFQDAVEVKGLTFA